MPRAMRQVPRMAYGLRVLAVELPGLASVWCQYEPVASERQPCAIPRLVHVAIPLLAPAIVFARAIPYLNLDPRLRGGVNVAAVLYDRVLRLERYAWAVTARNQETNLSSLSRVRGDRSDNAGALADISLRRIARDSRFGKPGKLSRCARAVRLPAS